MALEINEFVGNVLTNGLSIPAVVLPPLANQSLAVGATSVASSALNPRTAIVRLMADEDCRILLGVTPTAVATSMKLRAGSETYFGVLAGVAGTKIAVIAA